MRNQLHSRLAATLLGTVALTFAASPALASGHVISAKPHAVVAHRVAHSFSYGRLGALPVAPPVAHAAARVGH
jgi:hypothetical protein